MSLISAAFKAIEDSARVEAFAHDIEAWFGIPAVWLDGMKLLERTDSGSVWLCTESTLDWPGLEPETMGMLLYRDPLRSNCPSNAFLQRYGHLATRHAYDVNRDDALRFLAGFSLEIEPKDNAKSYAIVRGDFGGTYRPIGRGVVRGTTLGSEVPKALRIPKGAGPPVEQEA